MSASTIENVAAFSIVLGEMFVAVGLSTVAPAAVVTLAKVLKNPPAALAGGGAAPAPGAELTTALGGMPGPMANVSAVIKSMASNIDELHLLVPKRAKIFAEFEFKGGDSASGSGGVSVPLQVVSVNAGFTALYSSASSSKITLDIDFELAKFAI